MDASKNKMSIKKNMLDNMNIDVTINQLKMLEVIVSCEFISKWTFLIICKIVSVY
jgi:hypothetical protein